MYDAEVPADAAGAAHPDGDGTGEGVMGLISPDGSPNSHREPPTLVGYVSPRLLRVLLLHASRDAGVPKAVSVLWLGAGLS